MWAAIAIVSSLVVAYVAHRVEQKRFGVPPDSDFDDLIDDTEGEDFDIEDDDDDLSNDDYFDFLTVNEQFAEAKVTNDELVVMQSFIKDLTVCSIDNQMIVQLSWTDSDGHTNTYDLYCNGRNTATDCLAEIARREVYELRGTLSSQCSRLAKSTQGTPLFGKNTNAERKIMRKPSGECLRSGSKALPNVRKDD